MQLLGTWEQWLRMLACFACYCSSVRLLALFACLRCSLACFHTYDLRACSARFGRSALLAFACSAFLPYFASCFMLIACFDLLALLYFACFACFAGSALLCLLCLQSSCFLGCPSARSLCLQPSCLLALSLDRFACSHLACLLATIFQDTRTPWRMYS